MTATDAVSSKPLIDLGISFLPCLIVLREYPSGRETPLLAIGAKTKV
jgi:hypothetical protein